MKIFSAATLAAISLGACAPQQEPTIQRASCTSPDTARSARVEEKVNALTLSLFNATGGTVYTERSVHVSVPDMDTRVAELDAAGNLYCDSGQTPNADLTAQSTDRSGLVVNFLEYSCTGKNGHHAEASNQGIRGVQLRTSDGNTRDDIDTMQDGVNRALAFCAEQPVLSHP